MTLRNDTEKRIWANAFLKFCTANCDNPLSIKRFEEQADRVIELLRAREPCDEPRVVEKKLLIISGNPAKSAHVWNPATSAFIVRPGRRLDGMRFEAFQFEEGAEPSEHQDWIESEVLPRMTIPATRPVDLLRPDRMTAAGRRPDPLPPERELTTLVIAEDIPAAKAEKRRYGLGNFTFVPPFSRLAGTRYQGFTVHGVEWNQDLEKWLQDSVSPRIVPTSREEMRDCLTDKEKLGQVQGAVDLRVTASGPISPPITRLWLYAHGYYPNGDHEDFVKVVFSMEEGAGWAVDYMEKARGSKLEYETTISMLEVENSEPGRRWVWRPAGWAEVK